MRTVRDDSGKRYLLLKQSSQSSRVRDPETGEERHLDNDRVTVVEGESALETAAGAVPSSVRTVLTAVHDDRGLGLLVDLVDRGPLSVRAMLDGYDRCESDLLGMLTEFRLAGLVDEADVAGERGYEASETAVAAVELFRDDRP